MSIKDERQKLESMLNSAPDDISGTTPKESEIPEELQQPTIGVDFVDLKEECETTARIMLMNSIKFVLPLDMIEENEYLKNKLEIDVMSLSGMIYQLRVNELMQKAMMEEVDKGFIQPRMFEVFAGLSKTVSEINKQLIGTVEAIKSTYKEIKFDTEEKRTESLGTNSSQGVISQGDGGVIAYGTKDMIHKLKRDKTPPNN